VGALVADGGDLAVREGRLTEHAARNRESWAKEAADLVANAERSWAAEEIVWGMLQVPEREVGLLGDVSGKDRGLGVRGEHLVDPDLWVSEAARLLRPGGDLVFLVNGTLLMLASPDVDPVQPAGEELLRPYFGMRRFEWVDSDGVDFHLGYGDWIRVLRAHGFEVERLVELCNPGHDAGRYQLFTAGWAERWPAEEIWKARKA
jgi:SAM-dependent methyltransferase